MRVGDLVRWAGKQSEHNTAQDIGIVVAVGEAGELSPPYHTVHWFDDSQEYNYVSGDHDIQLIEKV